VAARDARPQLLLFPAVAAPVLTRDDGPCDLVVPDGTWRQARKMRPRVAGLAALPCRVLPATTMATTYRLRSERREGGLATLEAIAAALRILDGDRGDEIADAMLGVFRVMVSRTLWLRGQLRDEEVLGGIPDAARRHDPRGGLDTTREARGDEDV
jgi:DTW domain-containing protein YfiP